MLFFTVFQTEQSAFILQADYRDRMMKYKICNRAKKKTRLTDNLLAMMRTNVRAGNAGPAGTEVRHTHIFTY